MPGRHAEDAFLGEELGPIGAGRGLAVLRRHLLGPLRGRGTPRAHGTERMRHAPDRILVGHQHMVVAPCEAIRAMEIFDMARDPRRRAVALVAQEREVAGALLGDEHVPVRQHEEAARMGEPSGEERRLEARGHLRHVPFSGQRERAVGHDW